MGKLPQQLNLNDTQNRWATILDPIVANPIVNGQLLPNLQLVTGTNVINHKLGRKLIGWIPTRMRASATLYDTQDASQMPELTLTLVASANVTIDLLVF